MSTTRQLFPLVPLLSRFRKLELPPNPLKATLTGARKARLNEHFLDGASPAQLADELLKFERSACSIAWHESTLAQQLGRVRHGLAHLLRGQGPLAARFIRCARFGGPYHVAGVSPTFWAAVA